MGLDGKPRQLHVEESMQCIDFTDVEPGLDSSGTEVICECEHFTLEEHSLSSGDSLQAITDGRFAIITVVDGELALGGDSKNAVEGDFFIAPYNANCESMIAEGGSAKVLLTTWGPLS